MKRNVGLQSGLRILLLILILFICLCNTSIISFAMEKELRTKPKTIEFSLFEEINNTYKVQNAKFKYIKGSRPKDILKTVKEEGYIKSYKIIDGTLKNIVFNDNTNVSTGAFGKKSGFIFLVNDVFVSDNPLEYKLSPQDRLQIIFTLDIKTLVNTTVHVGNNSKDNNEQNLIYVWDERLSSVLNSACDKLSKAQSSIGISTIISLGVAKKEVTLGDILKFAKQVEDDLHNQDIEYMSNLLLASFACGIDPHSLNNTDYVKDVVSLINDNVDAVAIDEMVPPLMAITTLPDKNEQFIQAKNLLVKQLLPLQNDDGGFGSKKDDKSDVTSTASAVIALSQVRDKKDVNDVIDNSISYLSKAVIADEKFVANKINSATTIATIITALSSTNISVDDKRFSLKNHNLVDELLLYYLQDGSFSEKIGGEYDEKSTANSVVALIATKKGKNPFETVTKLKVTDIKNYNIKEVNLTSLDKVAEIVNNNKKVIITIGICFLLILITIITYSVVVKANKNNKQKED